jgi:hypothetical protein
MVVADFYHFEVTRVKEQNPGAEKCFSTFRGAGFHKRFLLPEHAAACQQSSANGQVQNSHPDQDGKGGVRQPGQNCTGSNHEEKEDKKTGTEKLPDPGMSQTRNAGQIIFAAPGKKKFPPDCTQQKPQNGRYPRPRGTWKKGSGACQKFSTFDQQDNPTQTPHHSGQDIQRPDMGNPSPAIFTPCKKHDIL